MEKNKKKGILSLAVQNIRHRSYRSAAMVGFVFVLSASFFASAFLLLNMKEKVNQVADRMGADLIVIPKGYTEELQEAMFTGEPCTIYFDSSWTEKIAEVDGVINVSPELYLATIADSECCAGGSQLIAYDAASDFIIQPWLNESGGVHLEKGEVIVGSNMYVDVGEELKYFDYTVTVKAKMEETGMTYDSCVFMGFDTARELSRADAAKKYLNEENYDNIISMVMVDIEPGYDADAVKRQIQYAYPQQGITVCTPNTLVSNSAGNVRGLQQFSMILAGILFLMTVLALLVIFTLTVRERKKEFGILYLMGMRKSQMVGMIMTEAGIISLAGGILGTGVTYGLLAVFRNLAASKLQMNQLELFGGDVIIVAVICVVLAFATGLLAAAYSAVMTGREEPYRLISENGL